MFISTNYASEVMPRAGWQGVSLVLNITLLSGCAVGPDFVRPAPPTSSRYTLTPAPTETVEADGRVQHFTSGGTVNAAWWRMFGSDQLNAVVGRAVAGNQTLQAAEASLRQSQDALRSGAGMFLPWIDATADARRAHDSSAQQVSSGSDTVFNIFSLSGTISYPLDVFGGERRAVESLEAQDDYQRHATDAAYLMLTANVVDACIAGAAYEAQIRTTRELIDLESKQLHAIEEQFRAGIAPYANVLSQRGLIAASQTALAPLRQQADQAHHLLALLEGVEPSQVTLPDIDLLSLTLPTDLPVSLPSDLVRQRPDILLAEAQMHVASANIGVATAKMFPSFSLSATYGVAGATLGNLSPGSAAFWSVGPSVSIPLFQGGSLWNGRKAAIDAYQQSQASYRQAVLAAFAQVADALKALEHDAEALQAQVEFRQVTEATLRLLQINARAGLVPELDVLAAEVQLNKATIAYQQAVALRHQDTVALLAALGGGWRSERAVADASTSP